jgi:hypothetical protein
VRELTTGKVFASSGGRILWSSPGSKHGINVLLIGNNTRFEFGIEHGPCVDIMFPHQFDVGLDGGPRCQLRQNAQPDSTHHCHAAAQLDPSPSMWRDRWTHNDT